VTELTEDDARELGQEAIARNDFEYAMDEALREFVSPPLPGPERVFETWARVLGQQHALLEGAAVLRWSGSTEPLKIVCSGRIPRAEWELLPGMDMAFDIRRSILEGKRFCGVIASERASKLTGCYVMVEPVRENNSEINAGLAIATRNHKTDFIGRMLKHATAQVGLVLAMHRISEERELGLRQMAGRISQMCSSSILLARCRLDELLNQGESLINKARSEVKRAIIDLDEAQQGFERARLLSVPSTLYAEDVDVGELLLDVISSVESGALPPIVSNSTAEACSATRDVAVRGSKGRLKYAFRDLLVLCWLLGERTPVDINPVNDIEHVRVRIVGGRLPRALQGEDLAEKLRDPDTYLVAPDEYKAERGIGLQLAWTLIEDEGGSLWPRALADGRLCFEVTLPAAPKAVAVKGAG
jgi:hypothetical protein